MSPLPDPNAPPDFAGGTPDIDQSIKGDVGLVRHYEGLLPGKRPYGWRCSRPSCQAENFGYIEDGCKACGAGRDGKVGKPEPAVDVLCRACRGARTIAIKCRACNGNGVPPDAANEDELCLDCGGSGQLTVDCRRCGATGFDPQPQEVERPAMTEMRRTQESVGTEPSMREVQRLPSLEEEIAAAVNKRRYFLMEVKADGGPAFITEIADSPRVRAIIQAARGAF